MTNQPPIDRRAAAPTSDNQQDRGRRQQAKIILGMICVVSIIVLCVAYRDQFSLKSLAAQEVQLRQFQAAHPVLVLCSAFLIYVLITGLSLPGAAALTLLYGWYFGWLLGTVLVSFASTTGATTAFLISRWLFQNGLRTRFSSRWKSFDDAWQRDGAWYLLSLRLIPAVPFFVVNLLMGLTSIPLWTFWWVSQLGMFPATVIYVYAGASVPQLQMLAEQGVAAAYTPAQLTRILSALMLLAALPITTRWLWQRFGKRARATGD